MIPAGIHLVVSITLVAEGLRRIGKYGSLPANQKL